MGSPATPATNTTSEINRMLVRDNGKQRCNEFMQMRLTSDAYWSDGVLIESKALLQGMSSHVLIEDIAPGEIQNPTVVLVFGDEPRGIGCRDLSVKETSGPCL